MQRKSIIAVNFKSVRPQISFTVFSCLFLLGALIGSIFICNSSSLSEYTRQTVKSFIDIREDGQFWPMLQNALLLSLPLYLVVFLCGTSFIGCVISPFVLAYYGFRYGGMAGYLYSTYKLDGIMFNALLLIPAVLVGAFGLIYITKESFYFSLILSRICVKNSGAANIYSEFKSYCIKCAFLLIFVVISTVVDLASSAMFMRFFNF